MAATTTKIGIINRGLQLLGQKPIASLNENSNGAKAMSVAYDAVLQAALRDNPWSFAIKRASLAASATPPIFGKSRAFPLPGDFLGLAPNEITYNPGESRDWEIEGQSILSDDPAPLNIRYISSSITESMFDALFAEAFAALLAMETAEQLTNSNSKKADSQTYYSKIISDAKKRNSIEKPPAKQPTVSWITARL